MTATDRQLLTAAAHALRSYQHGNDSTELAKGLAEQIEKRLKEGPQPFTPEEQAQALSTDEDSPWTYKTLSTIEALSNDTFTSVFRRLENLRSAKGLIETKMAELERELKGPMPGPAGAEAAVAAALVDATFAHTGTIAHGVPQVMECTIDVNGQHIKFEGSEITYDQVVYYACHQSPRYDPANPPMLTVVYRHRVPFNELPGERDGSLYRGQKVKVSPGMIISAVSTSNA